MNDKKEFAFNVGDRIKSVLKERGILQVELAQKAHISEVTISRYINGTRIPDCYQIAKIADALDVNIDDLVNCYKDNDEKVYEQTRKAIRENVDKWSVSRIYYLIKWLATKRPPY